MATSCHGDFEHLNVEDFADLFQSIEDLKQLSTNNADYYDGCPKEKADRGLETFQHITASLAGVELLCQQITPHVKDYDFSPETKGNGFRSLLTVTSRCLTKLVRLSQRCSKKRDRATFSSSSAFEEIGSYTEVLKCLSRLLLMAAHLLEGCRPETSVFPDEDALDKDVGWNVESLPRLPFYGSCLGFQYCASMRPLLQTISIAMAAYGDGFKKHGADHGFVRLAASLVTNSWKYIGNAKRRAETVVDLTTHCDLQFAKAFWSLTDAAVINQFPRIMGPSLVVNKVVSLPVQNVSLLHRDNSSEEVVISPPVDGEGKSQPVCVRVIVHKVHRAKEKDQLGRKRLLSTNSDGLLVHFHGGGFVAQSSKSHECYLRDWAHKLGVTIVSVDYSLAPEHPFPRGLDDCFFAYAWSLANYQSLYTNAKFVCVAGDSAGANLAVAMTLKAIDHGIRIPDGIVSAYGPFLIRYSVSPSRLLSVMDPILHHGILIKCLGAYAGQEESAQIGDVEELLQMSTSVDPPRLDTHLEIADEEHEVSDDDDLIKPSLEDSVLDSVDKTARPEITETEFEVVSDDDQLAERATCADFQESFRYHAAVQISYAQQTVSNGWSRLKGMVIGSEAEDVASPTSKQWDRRHSTSVIGVKQQKARTEQPVRRSWSEDPLQTRLNGLLPFCHPPITNNPYMSPYLASDELLSQLPDIHLIAAHLDPLLDDSVAFAHRLRSLKKWVGFHLVDNVPHGFLNFTLGSKEARQGSDLCVQCIAKVLHMEPKGSKTNRISSTTVDSSARCKSPASHAESHSVGDEQLLDDNLEQTVVELELSSLADDTCSDVAQVSAEKDVCNDIKPSDNQPTKTTV